jgi:endonuclease/exonuclease/phosphatase family metal-dependent hydrolase
MKKYIFTTPLLVAVCAFLFCNAANAQKKICMKAENPSDAIVSIMSYNIHNGTGMDGIRDYGRIAQVIKEIDPDVVALQEVDSVNARNGNLNGAAEIANAAGMHWTFGASLKISEEAHTVMQFFPKRNHCHIKIFRWNHLMMRTVHC